MKTQPQRITRKEGRGSKLKEIDVIVLAGGLGTRLRSVVSDRPKVLAEVGGRPFLDMLVNHLTDAGAPKIILSVGHLKDQIKDRYVERGVFFAEEESPLGTGGGLKNAERFLERDNVLVVNGDSWITGGVDLASFSTFHYERQALVTMLLAHPRTDKDYGAVIMDADNKISHFNEKEDHPREHFMSAGIYMMDKKRAFSLMPSGPFSLETDFFPKLVGKAFYGFPTDGEVVDIGTPERYEAAQSKFFS